MRDLALAITHHLAVFALLAILVLEPALLRRSVAAPTLAAVARIDLAYGALAGLALAAGLVRAFDAAKGWTFYAHNGFFWAKLATFVLIGLLSLPPTLKLLQWRQPQTPPDNAQVDALRLYLWLELALFALLPALAAAMARGYGQLD